MLVHGDARHNTPDKYATEQSNAKQILTDVPGRQRHELEALLLADIDALERVFHRHKAGIQQLRADISSFANTEAIDHGPTTHPSARLTHAILGYEHLKASNAYFVLAEAGLDAARAKCPRFDAWLHHWEQWGRQP